MTIERIERISDYRIYRDFRWPSDLLDFSRYNLFYGWNGSGKTTLSSIFGSLQSRRSIFSSDIRLRIGCATLHGKDFETATSPPIRVFNRDTIDRTLFEDPHQELPPVYYLGEESAEKQREVVQLKAEVEITKEAIGSTERRATEQRRLREKFCTEQAANIKNMLTTSGGGPYNYYNKQLYKQDADKILNNQIPGFCLTAHEKKRCIDTKNGSPLDKVAPILLLEIDYQALIKQVESLLSRSIVSSVIDELNNSPVISSWVQAGLKLHTGDNETATCHFCKQEIPDNRISELEGHFSDQLSRFQSEIDQLIRKIEGYVKAIEQLALPAKSLFYPHLRKDYERNASNWIKARLSLVTFLKALVSALKKKRDEPFQQLDINEVIFSLTNASEDSGWIMKVLAGIFDVAQNAITLLGLQTITNINQLISGHNQYTDEFSNQVKKARSDLAMDMVARAISEYQDFKTTINQLEEEYSSKKDEISVKNSKIDDLERDIRQHRKAADELNEEMCAYLGRNELKFETSDNGYRITRNGEPAFHLSEGERTAISFMYFLKR
ncbi:MAG: AAA family ATPase [Candidatus Sedimenticola sp. (ex Thyasira tokunagai)]